MVKEMPCFRGCGTMIHFDEANVSASGKKIPMESSGENHQCPNNDYKKGGQQKTFQLSPHVVKKAETDANEGTWRHDLFASLANIESALGILNAKYEALRVHLMGPDKAEFRPAADLKTNNGNEISGSDWSSGPGAYVQGGIAEEKDYSGEGDGLDAVQDTG
jgi:hypothetical protein